MRETLVDFGDWIVARAEILGSTRVYGDHVLNCEYTKNGQWAQLT